MNGGQLVGGCDAQDTYFNYKQEGDARSNNGSEGPRPASKRTYKDAREGASEGRALAAGHFVGLGCARGAWNF
jgi:hypothetical protein